MSATTTTAKRSTRAQQSRAKTGTTVEKASSAEPEATVQEEPVAVPASEPPTIHEAILRVMRDVRAVAKDGWNPQGSFNFRGIDATVNALGPAMRVHGIVPTPELQSIDTEMVEVGRNRSLMRMVTVVVRYVFRGPAGDAISAVTPGEAMDSGDKAVSKAMSVAYRTALLQTFILPTQERDPDEDTYERSPARPAEAEAERPRSEADRARDGVAEVMQAHGLNPQDVLSAYYRQHGIDLRNETDADKLRAFGKALDTDPQAVLSTSDSNEEEKGKVA